MIYYLLKKNLKKQ